MIVVNKLFKAGCKTRCGVSVGVSEKVKYFRC